ncbi:hypothetical protein FQN53_006780 [Emmonsiellopsis sp. PD_33]|nr:hypothetical protein FQN53_006780 [Emmonsiellopsis sp. PD_33]KAK2792992.1 hypothetical protein FQN51_001397 [Onygenales sp. PD_10]
MAPKAKKSKQAPPTTTTKPQQTQQKQQQQQQPPNWPPLKPLIPPTDLTLDTVLSDQILIIRNLFTSTLCKNYISFLSSLPLVTTPGRPKKGEAVRVNDRFQVDDAVFAERLWRETGLKGLVEGRAAEEKELWGGEVLGLNPNIRVYRYVPGQFFAQHYDDSIPLTHPNPHTNKTQRARTTWTLLIYLSTCAGGETAFYPEPSPQAHQKGSKRNNPPPEPIIIAPETGMALLHRHGERCLLHEGMEVRGGGEKWVVRSDLVVGV